MAFFRGIAKKLSSSGGDGESETKEKQDGFVLNYPSGQISFTQLEGDVYTQLAVMLDVEGTDIVGGRHGALFLRRSGLTTDQLRLVWKEACGGKSKPELSRDNWFVACKLVALTQASGTVSMDAVYANQVAPLPNFEINKAVPNMLGPHPTLPVPPGAFSVAVTNPTSMGTGMSRYTVYSVDSSTTLEAFPRKVMAVQRRFSDFEFLHLMLEAQFGGCLIPMLPPKKSFGNMDAEFVESRRAALDVYMRKVVRHPRLVESFALQVFLDATAEGFAAFRSLVGSELAGGAPPPAKASGVFGSFFSSISSAMPASLGRGAVVELPEDEDYKALVHGHSVLFANLSAAADATGALVRARRDCGYEVARLGSYLLELSALERRGDIAGASAFSERTRRAEAGAAGDGARAEASTAAAAGAGGPGAGSGPSAPTAAAGGPAWGSTGAGQWAGTAFGGGAAVAEDTGWSGGFTSNEAATAALFDDSDDIFGGPPTAAVVRTSARKKKQSRYAKPERPVASGDVGSSAELFSNFGGAVESVSNVMQDQLDSLQRLFGDPLMAELQAAVAVRNATLRRASAVEELQYAHAVMASKKKNYAAARASASGAAAAEASMAQAERRINQADTKLTSITGTLKAEMAERDRLRQLHLTTMLVELARTEARHCRERNTRWTELCGNTTRDEALIAESRRRIASRTLIEEPDAADTGETLTEEAFT